MVKDGGGLRLMYGLPIVEIDVVFQGRRLHLNRVLLDTGAAGTILDADVVSEKEIYECQKSQKIIMINNPLYLL